MVYFCTACSWFFTLALSLACCAPSQVGSFGGDNRAGVDRTLHRISAIRNRAGKVVGLTCRVGRAIAGGAEMVLPSLLALTRPATSRLSRAPTLLTIPLPSPPAVLLLP